MTAAIDNFDIVKSLMNFEESDKLFMHLQILRRGKDNPDLPSANKLINSWLVRSKEHLDKIKDDIVFLCEHYKARAYISCAPKRLEKLNTLLMSRLSFNIHIGNIVSPKVILDSACGQLPGIDKRWVVDIDSHDEVLMSDVKSEIGYILACTYPGCREKICENNWLISQIPTLNGTHLITRPFNFQMFKSRFPDIEIKRNGLTVIYIPECICNNNNNTTDK